MKRWSFLAGPLALVPFAAAAVATELAVTYSFPRVFAPNEEIVTALEGSVAATIAADGPIVPAFDYPDVEPIGENLYRCVFPWDDHAPRERSFVDAAQETLTVVLQPQPVMPLDLDQHDLLVFQLATAPASLWHPDTGIYVWGLHDNCLQSGGAWEREGQLDVYDAQHQLLASEPIGIRLNGESSRLYPQKSWRFYFDDYGPVDVVEADFFGEGPTSFERLVLKATWVPRFILSAALAEPLHRELGHLGSRLAPAAAYVNDEYWGLYTLRERIEDKFVEVTQGYADDDYVLIKDSEAEHGDLQEWENFLDLFAPPQPYASHAWYEEVRARLDLTSYVDWLLINAFGATADNGYVNNFAALKVGGGPWRFIMWDEEELFRLANVEANHLRFFASADEAEFAAFVPPVWYMGWWTPEAQRWFNVLRGLLQNSEFKAFFAARCAELLEGPLATAALQERLVALDARIGEEAGRQAQRWGWTANQYAATVLQLESFFAQRHPIFRQQAADLLDHFAVPVELSRFAAARTPAGAQLTWRTEREAGNLGFVVLRAVGGAGELAPIASWESEPALRGQLDDDGPTAYVWTDEDAPAGEVVRYQLRHVELGGLEVTHDWIVTTGAGSVFDLAINELLADNATVVADEAGEHEDWLELYNGGDADLDLAGLTLTDDLENPGQWTLPSVMLPAGGHLLVWCDGEPTDGPLHASFDLHAAGEVVGLFAAGQLIDSAVFGPQATDVSLGRRPDGGDTWTLFTSPTPGATNEVGVSVPPPAAIGLRLEASPNPFNPRVMLSFSLPQAGPCEVAVYAVDGRRVATLVAAPRPAGEHQAVWDGRDHAGRAMPSGTYLFRLTGAGGAVARKLVLLR